MSLEGLTPVVREVFGGLQTAQINQTKVPEDKSPLNQNVRFFPGGLVGTREGLTQRAQVSGSTDILGIKEYVDLAETRRLIVLTDDGTLRYEPGNYTFASIATNVVAAGVAPFLRLSSTSLFGKEWITFGASSIFGSNPAKVFYYDPGSTNLFFDPVAPEGPGKAPTVAGSATAGNVSLGTHSFAVFFRTRSGYWSQLGPSVTFDVSVASKSIDVSKISRGPSYVTERVIAATPAFSNNYYFLEGTAMVLKDNSTTSVTIDFTDTALTNGTPVSHPTDPSQDLLRQIVLPAPAAVAHYSGRLAYWGFRHQYVSNGGIGFPNMRFQGGWSDVSGNPQAYNGGAGIAPDGWTSKVSGATNGATISGSVYGDPIHITGTAAAQEGCLENSGLVSKIIPAGVEVWARIRVKKSASATGNLYVYFCPASQAAATVDTTEGVFSIAGASSSEWQVFSFRVNTAAQNSGYDSNTRLRISVGTGAANSLPNGETLDIDYIEIYTPGYDGENVTSLIRWSKVNNPEAVDGLYSPMLVEHANGQHLTACFSMRGVFYMCKERSMFATRDDGVSEPVDWPVDEVSSTIGTPSRFGVGLGDGWAVIVARSGLYLFDGQKPEKISQEIDPTWRRINFATVPAGAGGAAQSIWCLVDTDLRRIYIGAPLDGSTTVSHIIVLEWDHTDTPASERVRDYTLWTVAAICANYSYRSDGSKATLFGNSTSRLLQVDEAASSDNGAAINAIYRAAYMAPVTGRGTLRSVVAELTGTGNVTMKTYGPDGTTSKTRTVQALASAPNKFLEFDGEHHGEAVAVEFSQNSLTSNFRLSKLISWWKVATSGKTRGHVA